MIAPYGLKFIIIGAILTIAFGLWSASKDSPPFLVVSIIIAIMTLFLLFFYRNPLRHIPTEKNLILSIADGRILSVEPIENEYIGGHGTKVSIFLSLFNVHINRIPTAGQLDYVKYVPGKFFKAFLDRASEENEHTEIGLVFGGNRMIFKQIAGILARRITCNASPGQTVHGGEVFGMIHLGSRTELFLPMSVEVLVKKGDQVKAGQSIIGRIEN